MITIIIGPPGSGKTSKAQEIASNYKNPVLVAEQDLEREDLVDADLLIIEEFNSDLTHPLEYTVFLALLWSIRSSGIDAVFCFGKQLNKKAKFLLKKQNIEIIDLFPSGIDKNDCDRS